MKIGIAVEQIIADNHMGDAGHFLLIPDKQLFLKNDFDDCFGAMAGILGQGNGVISFNFFPGNPSITHSSISRLAKFSMVRSASTGWLVENEHARGECHRPWPAEQNVIKGGSR